MLPLLGVALLVAAALAAVYLIGGNASRFTGDALRFELWRGALQIGADHPLLGVGVGMFGREYRDYRVFGGTYDNRLGTAHNAYLNTFAKTGVLGLALMIAFGVVIGWAFWRRWRVLAANPTRAADRTRLEGAFAALVGFGVQSIFDTFVVTPLALLTVVLVVLVAVEPGQIVRAESGGSRRLRWAAPPMALLIAVYGIGQGISDTLYGQFRAAGTLEEVEAVAAADPNLALYRLQVVALRDQAGDPEADALHADMLAEAPTWDIGWINRAALAENRGDDAAALEYLDRARSIDRLNGSAVHWARIAESTGAVAHADLIDAYALSNDGLSLPLSTFWGETPARQDYLGILMVNYTLSSADLSYRVLQAHDPEQIEALLNVVRAHEPPTPGDLWVLGEAALSAGGCRGRFRLHGSCGPAGANQR
ncbi:MAG: O-antigen ligase family protein [Chloroflexi bacterium]|nr:O-antigen ligase family protein [Chloroflexota bacterium]